MRDDEFPADPYPGSVPPFSYVHLDATSHRLGPDPHAPSGWRVGGTGGGGRASIVGSASDRGAQQAREPTVGTDLDAWLAAHDAPPAAARVPVLAYGSNRCPSKITWLRTTLGLDGPVVVLRARTTGVAAVWAHGLRARDGQRPAVLAATPGAAEEHAVWLATPRQVAVLDRCEGRGERFRLARLRTGTVTTEDGMRIDEPWCYAGHGAVRRPLCVDGRPVRCLDVPQAGAHALAGDPGPDGLDAPTERGAPHPDAWPAALFAYGLLMPGQPSWPLVAPHAGTPRPAHLPGTLYDTGHGWPALVPGGGDPVPGIRVPLTDPAAVLPVLDAYEGPSYTRVRRALADGTACWVYAWRAPTAGMARLSAGWPR